MSCEDIPSLLDIQNTKKHIDDFGRLMGTGEGDSTNEVTGQVRPTYNKAMKSVGFKPGSGDFTTGFTVMPSERDVAWYDPVSKNWYSYIGVIPTGGYPVVPGTNPVGDVNWKPVTDSILRGDLISIDGASQIGSASYAQIRAYSGTGSTINCFGRTNVFDGASGVFDRDDTDLVSADNDGTVLIDALGRRWKRRFVIVDMRWFGVVGDSVFDNAAKFTAADALGKTLFFDGSGTYFTTYEPTSLVYTNAKAKIKIGGVTITLSQVPLQITAIEQAEFDNTLVRLSNTLVGIDAAPNLLSNANSYGNTAYGTGAMQNAVEAKRVTAIGPFAVRDPIIAYSVTGIGTTALEWMVYGDRLTFVGDNSGKNLGNPDPVGRHAYFDPANPNPNDWDTRWPAWRTYAGAVNAPAQVMTAGDFGNKATHMVGVGRNAFGFSLTAKDAVALGYDAGTSLLYGQDNVFVGDRAGQWTIKGDFSTWVGSKAARSLMDSFQDTGVGYFAGSQYVHSKQNSVFGYQAMAGFQANLTDVPELNCFFGRISGANAVGSIKRNAGYGPSTLAAVRSDDNTALGSNSLLRLADPVKGRNTGAGADSLILMQDLSNCTSIENSSGLGYQARVSGDNQVQLGNSATTTYVFGTVQNRSDARDKADLRPTTLLDDFIDGLEAEEGFWDMRDDYFEEYQVQIGIDEDAQPVFETRYRAIEKDGSKKRNRRHQWFVAQKLKSLCEELGVDFGGLQDHSINGGCDVLTVGYDEFIPPLTAYVQRRKAELRALEQVVDKQAEVIAAQGAAIKAITARLDKLEG